MSYPETTKNRPAGREIPHLKNNPTLKGMYHLEQQVVYSTQGKEEQRMTLITPWSADHPELSVSPLPFIVFVQGSGWKTPDFDFQLPQLCSFAREGFVVATVSHRNTQKGHPFPAFLQDVKCAIRYLRRYAEKYGLDPERGVIWGTSSGGNIAQLVALTGDDPRYETEEHAGYSDAVKAAVSCFGPTDVEEICEALIGNPAAVKEGEGMFGTSKDGLWQPVAREMSPYDQAAAGKKYPPQLLLNGTADPVVPGSQMEKMYRRLLELGAEAEAYLVDGAIHEYDFWSQEVLDIILAFIKKYI